MASAVETCEPSSFDDLVFPSSEQRRQVAAWIAGKGQNHLLLHGPSGSGKTSLAKLLPKLLERRITNNPDADPKAAYIDCQIRLVGKQLEGIQESALLVTFNDSGLRYYVLDEFDNWAVNQQKQLKNTFELGDHLRFIIITNDPTKIDPGIANRCEEIEWTVPLCDAALPHLKTLAKKLGKQIPDDELRSKMYSPKGWRTMIGKLDKYGG